MPGAKVFVDTNVLLYLHDRSDAAKALRSQKWLTNLAAQQVAVINLQVLNELTYVLLRKRWFDDVGAVFAIVDDFASLGSTPIEMQELEFARQLHKKCGYSWWDCLLLASAINLGCSHFLSEDLQDGHAIEGLTIVDPFAHTPDEILAAR